MEEPEIVQGPVKISNNSYFSNTVTTNNNTTSSLIIIKDNTLQPIILNTCKSVKIDIKTFVDDVNKNKYFHFCGIWIFKYDQNGDITVPVKYTVFNINAGIDISAVYTSPPSYSHNIDGKKVLLTITCPAYTSGLNIYSDVLIECLNQ